MKSFLFCFWSHWFTSITRIKHIRYCFFPAFFFSNINFHHDETATLNTLQHHKQRRLKNEWETLCFDSFTTPKFQRSLNEISLVAEERMSQCRWCSGLFSADILIHTCLHHYSRQHAHCSAARWLLLSYVPPPRAAFLQKIQTYTHTYSTHIHTHAEDLPRETLSRREWGMRKERSMKMYVSHPFFLLVAHMGFCLSFFYLSLFQ